MVPSGGVEQMVNNLDELNEHYTYNVGKEEMDACMDNELDSLLAIVGDYVSSMSHRVTPEGFLGSI